MKKLIFEDLRVLEFGDGMACSLAGLLLADNGAEVLKIEPPAGAQSRENPAFPMWARGKKSVVLDLSNASDQAAAQNLVRSSDIVLSNFGAGEAEKVGLNHGCNVACNPGLITATISGFGRLESLEHVGMDDSLVSAKSGRVCNNGLLSGSHHGKRAIFLATPTASCGAGFLAVQGIVAALIERLRTGKGQEVKTSLLDGLSAATMRLAFERKGDDIVPVELRGGSADLVLRCIELCFMVPECRDGRYLQMCARQTTHFHNWLAAMDLSHLTKDPRFCSAPLGLKSFEDAEALENLIRSAMKKRTTVEWMELFTSRYDVGADPFLLPEEFMQHPQMVLNDRIITLDDPEKGAVKQVGPLALFSETPSQIASPAPQLGEHQAELYDFLKQQKTPPDRDAVQNKRTKEAGPLEGITIVELAYYLAAPLAATTLAEMGARVIKVEPIAGDPFRGAGLEFVHIVAGKESIAVDLKTDEGLEVFDRLICRSDALLHNFRPGVPERLNIDYKRVSSINPDIVYLYGASYGSKGPQKHRPAFHATPNALTGGGIMQAGRDNPPVDDSYPDPISGLGAGAAMAMGLYAKRKFGIGQYIETTMLTSTGYAQSEILTLYEGAPAMPLMDQGQHGLGALHRLYCCSDGGYVFISAKGHLQWEGLVKALGREDFLNDSLFRDEEARKVNSETLVELLAPIFQADTPQGWENRLAAFGVPAAAVFPSFEKFLADKGFLEEGDHPAFGAYWKLKPRICFSENICSVRAPSAIGEHSQSLLQEIGFKNSDIERFLKNGIVRDAV